VRGTAENLANALGTLRLLEVIRILGFTKRARLYQASTSELYGKVRETPQRATTPFYSRSPYAAAKLYAYWITVNYREVYGFHAKPFQRRHVGVDVEFVQDNISRSAR